MRPFVGTLIVEGEVDADGRVVAPGALEWRTPIPIYDVERRRILGHAYAVDRVGDEIVAAGSVDLPVGEYAVDAGVVIDSQDIAAGEHRIVAGRIRDAAITPEPSFARARIAVGRDRTDADVERLIREGVRDAYLPRTERSDD